MRSAMLVGWIVAVVTCVANFGALAEAVPAGGTSAAPPVALQGDLRQKAVEQVLASAQSSDPFLRANAIEAVQADPDRAAPLAQLGLEDKSAAVRFVALTTIGKLRLLGMVPAVERRLAAEKAEIVALRQRIEQRNQANENEAARLQEALGQSRSVCAAALFALHRCGRAVDVTPLAGMLASPDLSVRGNAALLLGLMDDRSAVPLLEDMAKVPAPRASAERQALLRLQLTEALVRLGSDTALTPLRAALYSQFAEARVLAVSLTGEINDRPMLPALNKLLSDPKMEEVMEVRVAAAAAMARMGDGRGTAALQKAARSESPLLRSLAARGLGYLHDAESTTAIAALLDDAEEQVRLTAASAVLRAVSMNAVAAHP